MMRWLVSVLLGHDLDEAKFLKGSSNGFCFMKEELN
ncbi:hypothetical protein PC116_g30271 [Phytophthora cactorum]|nr:hypothetical protein PC116_g30271 [Phytophthora cactorum]